MEDTIFTSVLACLPPPPPVSITARISHGDVTFSSSGSRCDRISQLSDDLLCTVVSKLGRTTTLSSRWRRVWASSPLVLDDTQLLPAGADEGGSDAVVGKVSRVVASHQRPFRSVHLTCSDTVTHRGALKEWIRAFAVKSVGDLVVLNRRWWTVDVILPAELLRCTSLERLYVAFCNLPEVASQVVDFPKLKELVLCHACLPAEDVGLLLAGSPKLETLAFVQSFGVPTCVNVSSSPRLKCLVLWLFKPQSSACWTHRALSVSFCGRRTHMSYVCLPRQESRLAARPVFGRSATSAPASLYILFRCAEAGTKASPCVVVPSVETLGVDIKFGDREEERMLLSFLRLFPNVKTLYIKSSLPPNDPHGELDSMFWENSIDSIKYVWSQLRKLVFYEFQGENYSEFSFIKSIAESASLLKEILIVLPDSISYIARPGEMKRILKDSLPGAEWASDEPKLDILRGDMMCDWDYKTASDLSRDPFDFVS